MWRVLCVEGMWFQDLFNYDFRRTEMCVIPYGTQEGEISFLRLQHRRRLAADHREHAQDGEPRRVVQGARPPRRLRQGQARPRHPEDALALSLPIVQAILAADADAPVPAVTPYLVAEEEEAVVS